MARSEGEAVPEFAGQITKRRVFGRAMFLRIDHTFASTQLHVRQDLVGEEVYELLKAVGVGTHWIHGEGYWFITRDGDRALRVQDIQALCPVGEE